MLRKLLACFSIFVATYLVLSIEIGGKPLFSTLYRVTAPLTGAAQSFIGRMVDSGMEGTREVGGKLFQNSNPATRAKSALRPIVHSKGPSAPQETILEDERRELHDLIKDFDR